MSLEDVKTAIEQNTLPVSVAEKYLRLYVADIDWTPHLGTMWESSKKKLGSENLAREHVKKAVGCATILPLLEKTPIPDAPHQLLFWCTGWRQFNEQDWFKLFLDVLKEDVEITEKRNSILQLGVIDPIDVPPMTRQAFNWLYEKALSDINNPSDQLLADLKIKFSNLVKAYGGAIICNMFVSHKLYVDKVLNWRSGYFFEKQIHKVYSVEQIKKIKLAELGKTNEKYIKKMGVSNG